MLQNRKVHILCRIICLITFVLVTVHVNSFITLSLLTIAFYLFTRNDNDKVLLLWYVITIIVFLISYLTSSYWILKIVLIIDLGYYFLNKPSQLFDNFVVVKNNIVFNKYFIRFKEVNKKRKDEIDSNLICTIYLVVHMFILLVSIMVG